MTPEEIQRTIEQMLAVQRELQNRQLEMQERQSRQEDEISGILSAVGRMLEVQRGLQESQLASQESQLQQREDIDRMLRLVDRLIGYSITNESDHISLEERMAALERRVRRLEPEN